MSTLFCRIWIFHNLGQERISMTQSYFWLQISQPEKMSYLGVCKAPHYTARHSLTFQQRNGIICQIKSQDWNEAIFNVSSVSHKRYLSSSSICRLMVTWDVMNTLNFLGKSLRTTQNVPGHLVYLSMVKCFLKNSFLRAQKYFSCLDQLNYIGGCASRLRKLWTCIKKKLLRTKNILVS